MAARYTIAATAHPCAFDVRLAGTVVALAALDEDGDWVLHLRCGSPDAPFRRFGDAPEDLRSVYADAHRSLWALAAALGAEMPEPATIPLAA